MDGSETLAGILTSRGIPVVGDGTWLTVGETLARLEQGGCVASDTTVRSYATRGLLRAHWTAGGHTRIEAKSVDELMPLLRIRVRSERDAKLEELRARNLAQMGDGGDQATQ